ncbi:50S ribosomal protein L21 [bioreactor metagenome]|uniref:50S ribosomal protein L21 n=1 Tax=bioreactor metagenome TaxID=1076179 RepID=A0A645CPG7_9ZZZZ|nr:50S ribosomal protein L21 [Oscillospiraceae bacterium]
MFAVFTACGKQYKVQEGDIVFLEKMNVNEGETVTFDEILVYSDNNGTVIGAPTVAGATVTANVVKNGKNKKIYIIKYKSKKNEKKKQGHRQPYTKVQIATISAK